MNTTDKLQVAYSSDNNYACFLGISMYSLFQSNTGFSSIVVYALDCGIQEDNREKLRSIAREWNREIVFVPMDEALGRLDLRMGAHKISVASYARLFLPLVLPETCDKVLYLDCDTIVLDDLTDLWNTDLKNTLIGGVQDTVDQYFQKIIHLPAKYPYINAGILLINLKAWRDEHLSDKFQKIVQSFDGNVPHHDQGCINAACQGRRTLLPVRYNFSSNMYSFSAKTIRRIYFLNSFYSQEELSEAIRHPGIVHFTSGLVGRPWEEGCTHPEQKTFWEIVRKTPWADLKKKPDSRKKGLKCFIWFHRVLPTAVFEWGYRSMCWVLHLRK